MKIMHNIKKIQLKYTRAIPVVYGLILIAFLPSCEDFVKVDPPKTLLGASTAFTDDIQAASLLTGIYSRMTDPNSGFASGTHVSVTYLSALSADEFVNYSTARDAFAVNALDASYTNLLYLWNEPYSYIYSANNLIEGLSESKYITDTVKMQLVGEAKFIRAFCYFYLVNLFGNVPLHTTTDYRVNAVATRTPQEQVYQQIIADLEDAKAQLKYEYTTVERVRPNKSVAAALLARAYLYQKDWVNAESQATSVINNTDMYNLADSLDDVFLANSKESIWQLMPVAPGYNTNEAISFAFEESPVDVGYAAISTQLIDSFEIGDKRKTHWIKGFTDGSDTWFYPYKYKISETDVALTEYSTVLRLAELYLIRSEARAWQSDVSGSQTDLNAIRNRAGLNNTTANDQSSLLTAIEHERQIELFSEWGHRWLDLKRTNRADAILGALKGDAWQSTDALYPIPQAERKSNPKITQNDGY